MSKPKRALFFDTNFLYKKNFSKSIIKQFSDNNLHLYTSEIVIEELKGQNVRDIRDAYQNIIKKIEETDYPELYFSINDETNLEEAYKKSDEKMDKYYEQIFNDRIISVENKKDLFDNLLYRSKMKMPPFRDIKNASDKGFNDTLLWLTLLEYLQANNKYEEYYLVTKDKGFIEDKEFFKKEIKNIIEDKKFEIINVASFDQLFQYFNIQEKEIKETDDKDLPFEKVKEVTHSKLSDEFIKKTKNTMQNIFSGTDYDWSIHTEIDIDNFNVYRELSKDELIEFCNLLEQESKNFTFLDDYNLTEILNELKIESRNNKNVSINHLNDFVDIWQKINQEFNEHYDSFIKRLQQHFNEIVISEQKYSNNDDLPF